MSSLVAPLQTPLTGPSMLFVPVQTVNYASAYGTPIPLSQGLRKVTGTPIWQGPVGSKVVSNNLDGSQTVGSNPSALSTTTTLFRSFAVSLGYQLETDGSQPPPKIRRVWIDGTLVFANGSATQPVFYNIATGQYNPTIGQVPIPAGLPPVTSDGAFPPPAPDGFLGNLTYTFYDGSETQLPDWEIQADKGAIAPAFRGMMYLVVRGLPVGQGTMLFQYTSQFGFSSDLVGSQAPAITSTRLPVIQVELMDGTSLPSFATEMTPLPGSLPFGVGVVVLSDFRKRLLCTNTGAHLHTFDMDAKVEIDYKPITGIAGIVDNNGFGDPGKFNSWDLVNDVIYGQGFPGATIAAVNRATGAGANGPYTHSFDLAALDSMGANAIPSGTDAVVFPRFWYGDVEHAIINGANQPVVFGITQVGYVAALTPSNDGMTWPAAIPNKAMLDFTARSPNSICAMPLRELALQKGHNDFQDTAFLIGSGQFIYLALVTVRPGPKAAIVSATQIYDSGDPTLHASAFLDANGAIVVTDTSVSIGLEKVSLLPVVYDFAPNYSLAPGWNGIFPHVQPAAYKDLPLNVAWNGGEPNVYVNSDFSRGNFAYLGGMINLADGAFTFTDLGALGGGTGEAWDSGSQTMFFRGAGVDGERLLWARLSNAITGTVGSLASYLTFFAERGGYTVDKINIDNTIKDQVVGALITAPTDLSTLFDQIAAVYGLIWFDSGGVLKFVKQNRSPIKATNTLTISANPVDGATVTIGTFVYRFKNVMSAPFDVQIEPTKESTIANLAATVNGSGTAGISFFAGTVSPHTSVNAAMASNTAMTVTALLGGAAGNLIGTTSTSGALVFATTTLLGGNPPPEPVVELTSDDMSFIASSTLGTGDVLVTTFPAPISQGVAVAVTYYNLDADYAMGTQQYTPDQGTGLAPVVTTVTTYNLPFTMANAEAYDRVTKVALRTLDSQVIQELQLTQKHMQLEPSDVVGITINNFAYTVRLNEVTYNADFTMSINGTNYSFRDDVVLTHAIPPQVTDHTIHGPGDGVPVVIDGPVLNPAAGSTAGIFALLDGVASYGQAGWEAASLGFELPGSTYMAELFQVVAQVKGGQLVSALPDTATPWLTDYDTTMRLVLKSATSADFVNAPDYLSFSTGVNMLIVGAPGRWEYILFRNVNVLSAKVVELTGLVRGLRGTEVNTGNHVAGDQAYLVSSAATGFEAPLRQQSLPKAEIGATARYQAIGIPASRTPSQINVTFQGYTLYPFAPCHPKAVLAGGNDINLTWVRRDRLGTDFVTTNLALSETAEKYDLVIYSGGTIVRTLVDLTAPAYTYTAAQQTADGFTVPLASLKIALFQKGELGRGFEKLETLNVQ
jgi:hypothetical protein